MLFRSLTHDLFLSFAKAFEVQLLEVVIYKLEEGIFYSELVCVKGEDIVRIDSRTSDAVALALRFNCPIYTYEDILAKAGIVLDFGDSKESTKTTPPRPAGTPRSGSPLANKSLEELQTMLDQAVGEENYEKASEIRDEIKRREK